MPWPQGPMHRRAQWPGYRPHPSGLSTPIVKKLSHRSQVFWDAKKSLCFGPLAALEPHSCDVLTIRYALNRRRQWGLLAFSYRDRRSRGTRRLSHAARKLREICSPLTFEAVADLLLASDSRISMRAARHAPESPFPKGRMRDPGLSGEVRMLMEFGGTVA